MASPVARVTSSREIEGALAFGEILMKLTQIIAAGAVVPALAGQQRDEVVKELIDALVACGAVPAELAPELLMRVLDRERKGSTGFGRGVAVPHVKHTGIKKMCAAVGLSRQGIEFNSLDRLPVYSVFLLVSPEDRPDQHLQAMEVIFKNLSKDTFRKFLRQASSLEEINVLLEEADGSAFGT